MREQMSKVERELYTLVLEETVAGRPPLASRLVELTGRSKGGVYDALSRLVDRGLVSQGYERGPYVPAATQAGQPIELQLVLGVKPEPPGPDNAAKVQAITRKARLKLGLDPDGEDVPKVLRQALEKLLQPSRWPEPNP